MKMNRMPISPRWKRSIQAAYDLIIENAEYTLPFDIHKTLLSRGHIVKTYSHLSTKSNTSFDEICEFFGSKDGTSHYLLKRNKYAVCYNDQVIPQERIKWTLAHELGHISLGHLGDFPQTGTEHPILEKSSYRIFEAEANVFARELLAPSSVFIYIAELYKVHEPLCFYTIARSIFRLSKEASYYIATDLSRNYAIYVKGQPYLGGIHVAEAYSPYLYNHYFKRLPEIDIFSTWLKNYQSEFEFLTHIGLGNYFERTHPGLRSISDVILAIISTFTPPHLDR